MDRSGDQPASGKRRGMHYARFDDDHCAKRGCRRTLVTEFADGTDGWRLVLRVLVGALNCGYDEQRKGDGHSHRRARARLHSSKTDQVGHVCALPVPRRRYRPRETGADTDVIWSRVADQGNRAERRTVTFAAS